MKIRICLQYVLENYSSHFNFHAQIAQLVFGAKIQILQA